MAFQDYSKAKHWKYVFQTPWSIFLLILIIRFTGMPIRLFGKSHQVFKFRHLIDLMHRNL